jgi:predicted transcriptional regulator
MRPAGLDAVTLMTMSVPDPEALAAELRHYAFEHDRLRWELARAAGVGITDVLALEQLEVGGPLKPDELGRRLSLPARQVYTLIDRLELAGLVRRYRTDGGRYLHVEASPTDPNDWRGEFRRHQMQLTELAAHVPIMHREAVLEFLSSASSAASGTPENLTPEAQPQPDQT